jgi:hypothetical protein
MQLHPGIVFRAGPGGRRAGLAGGPDVWEVVRVFRGLAPDEDGVRRTGELMSLLAQQVEVAIRYYAEFQDEIDSWIRELDQEAERAEAVWRREQQLLAR